MVRETQKTVTALGPALRLFIEFISGENCDRVEVKEACREVRNQHRHVRHLSHQTTADVYNTDMDFKDIYQIIHFIERLYHMSHSTEGCANILRAMIAREGRFPERLEEGNPKGIIPLGFPSSRPPPLLNPDWRAWERTI